MKAVAQSKLIEFGHTLDAVTKLLPYIEELEDQVAPLTSLLSRFLHTTHTLRDPVKTQHTVRDPVNGASVHTTRMLVAREHARALLLNCVLTVWAGSK